MTNLTSNLWQNLKAGDVISLWDIMAEILIEAEDFFMFSESLSMAPIQSSFTKSGHLKKSDDYPDLEADLARALYRCGLWGLTTSLKFGHGVLTQKTKFGNEITSEKLSSVQQVIRAELEGINFLLLDSKKSEIWKNKSPFGSLVADKFPTSSEDISEANKCWVVERYTASVFHLMRAMEAAIAVMANAIGATTVTSKGITGTWSNILGQIDKALSSNTTFSKAKKKEWSDVRSSLWHVKESWRNETMHPKNTYTETEATEIINAVSMFMKKLASMV